MLSFWTIGNQILRGAMPRVKKNWGENIGGVILALVAILYSAHLRKWSWQTISGNTWETIAAPALLALCIVLATYLIKSALAVYRSERKPFVNALGRIATLPPWHFRWRCYLVVVFYLTVPTGFFIAIWRSSPTSFSNTTETKPPTPKPPFVLSTGFIFGVPLGENYSPDWLMSVQHYGPDPAYNCDFNFYDEDRLHIEHLWLTKHPDSSFPPAGIADGPSQWGLHIDELDPIENPRTFDWKPLNPNQQHYTAEIICRSGQFHEEWNTTRINGFLRTKMILKQVIYRVNKNYFEQIFGCTDPEFSSAPLAETLPKVWPPHPVNPGWKPNHRFEFPVAILAPNNTIQVAGSGYSQGCWDLLTKHYGSEIR